jgi:hypothetical protein
VLKTSGFVKANSNSNVIYAYYYFTDISEINVVGSLLGLNLLEVITIFRAYRVIHKMLHIKTNRITEG